MQRITVITKEDHRNWTKIQIKKMANTKGVVHEPCLNDFMFDLDMMVKGPANMANWLYDNAINLFSIGEKKEFGWEKGNVYVKLTKKGKWVMLTDELVNQVIEDE